MKKYWNSDEFVLGLKTNGSSKAKPVTVIIIAIILLYGYLMLFNAYIYQIDFLYDFLNWPDRNIIRGSFLSSIVLLAHVGIGFLSLIHFALIMFQWFQAIYNANKK